MEAMVLAFVTWIHTYSGLPIPEEMPNIRFIPRCEIQQMAYEEEIECQPVGPVAVYDHLAKTPTIYLREYWRPDLLLDQSTLLHELYHHMQHESGITFGSVECVGRDLELPAYKAQFLWLKEQGVSDPLKTIGINKVQLMFVTSCQTYHP